MDPENLKHIRYLQENNYLQDVIPDRIIGRRALAHAVRSGSHTKEMREFYKDVEDQFRNTDKVFVRGKKLDVRKESISDRERTKYLVYTRPPFWAVDYDALRGLSFSFDDIPIIRLEMDERHGRFSNDFAVGRKSLSKKLEVPNNSLIGEIYNEVANQLNEKGYAEFNEQKLEAKWGYNSTEDKVVFPPTDFGIIKSFYEELKTEQDQQREVNKTPKPKPNPNNQFKKPSIAPKSIKPDSDDLNRIGRDLNKA